MKEFFEVTYKIKSLVALFFMGGSFMYFVVSLVSGNKHMPISFLWQMFILALLLTLMQYVIYHDKLLPKVSVKVKVVFHYAILLITLISFIYLFNWFNLKNFKYFIIFYSIYTLYFIIMCMYFSFYYKITGERFNKMLNKYKTLNK